MHNPYSHDPNKVRINADISREDHDYLRRISPAHGAISAVVGQLVKGFLDDLRTEPQPSRVFWRILAKRSQPRRIRYKTAPIGEELDRRTAERIVAKHGGRAPGGAGPAPAQRADAGGCDPEGKGEKDRPDTKASQVQCELCKKPTSGPFYVGGRQLCDPCADYYLHGERKPGDGQP
jgi:hypothetical protein